VAFTLNKNQQAIVQRAIKLVESKKGELDGAVEAFNEKLKELFGELEERDTEFTAAVGNLRSIIDSLVNRWRSEWDEKSGRWQDSERGEAVSDFIDEWDIFARGLPELSFERPEPLETSAIPDFQDLPADKLEV
jgi:seryl-tRNA synthetase